MHNQENNKGKTLLLVAGWLSVVLAFFEGSLILSIIAVCIGIVLRKDYHDRKKGLYLIIFGIVMGLSGPLLGWFVIRSMQ
ncbi:hypothetical protein BSG1_04930 [Bacillus sp. SG-1]|nr:hypothetical protein BSG1_04930 [Bacillus sp. SG-1]